MPKDEIKFEPKEQMNDAKSKTPKYTYRYVCEGCTGVAFYWEGQGVTPQTKFPAICQNCGRAIGPIKPTNFIKL
jgi:hypothetical protein